VALRRPKASRRQWHRSCAAAFALRTARSLPGSRASRVHIEAAIDAEPLLQVPTGKSDAGVARARPGASQGFDVAFLDRIEQGYTLAVRIARRSKASRLILRGFLRKAIGTSRAARRRGE
jgi:hypothetical protein